MNRKIVFFDIDGTIYNYNIGIPKDTYSAIKLLKKNGHIPVICTGRTRCMIYPEHLKPGFEHIVAGAGTYVEADKKRIFLKEMNQTTAKKLIKSFLSNGFVPVAEGVDHVYLGTDFSQLTDDNKKVLQVYQNKMGKYLLTIDEADIKISKISGLYTNNCNMKRLTEEYKKDYFIINHNNHLLEFVPKPYNKAVGIKKMLEYTGIDRDDSYAFGDSFNDIDMLEYVKYGCVMGNGEEEIKKRLNYVTDDFDQGGIMNGLKKFGLI